MSTKHRTLRWLVLAAFILAGCVVIVLVLPRLQELSLANKIHRASYDQGILFTGIWVDGRVEYSRFYVDFQYRSESPEVWIEIAGESKHVKDVSRDDMLRWHATQKEATSGAEYWEASFCEGVPWACTLLAEFENGKPVGVDHIHRQAPGCECRIRVSLDGHRWVQLPATQDRLIDTLGPPAKVYHHRPPH